MHEHRADNTMSERFQMRFQDDAPYDAQDMLAEGSRLARARAARGDVIAFAVANVHLHGAFVNLPLGDAGECFAWTGYWLHAPTSLGPMTPDVIVAAARRGDEDDVLRNVRHGYPGASLSAHPVEGRVGILGRVRPIDLPSPIELERVPVVDCLISAWEDLIALKTPRSPFSR